MDALFFSSRSGTLWVKILATIMGDEMGWGSALKGDFGGKFLLRLWSSRGFADCGRDTLLVTELRRMTGCSSHNLSLIFFIFFIFVDTPIYVSWKYEPVFLYNTLVGPLRPRHADSTAHRTIWGCSCHELFLQSFGLID